MKRIIRDRKLTSDEAEKYNGLRSQVELEKPVIIARIRRRPETRSMSNCTSSPDATFGQRIRSARESKGEFQVSLAAGAGISQGYLSQIEADDREPTFSIAVRLARALDISLDELADKVDSET
ncbi:MAG: helix-turn-helix transcriptional regulator [Planctomycetaceae bacterium]